MRALVRGAAIADLTAGAAWAAPRTDTVPDPAAQLRPPKDGRLTAGSEAAQACCQTWTAAPRSRPGTGMPSGMPRCPR